MELKEYIAQAKKELDEMEESYMNKHVKDPDNWPLDRTEGDWEVEELVQRFQ